MKVTLTFDNGPHPDVTPGVLRVLGEHDLQGYFFVVGEQIERHGVDLPAQAVAEGHRIGNHTYTHSVPLGLQPAEAGVLEISATQALIADLAGDQRYFRPFGGKGAIGPHLMNRGVWDHLRANAFNCVLWNCLAYEWDDAERWVAPTLERCRAQAHSVVVLHDLPTGAMTRLDDFIRALKDDGAEFSLDFPDDCLPLKDGVPMWSTVQLEHVIAGPRRPAASVWGDSPRLSKTRR